MLNNGKLLLGDDSALGRGALTVVGASTLATVTPLELNNSVEIKADLKVVADHRLALNEKITGVGKIIKSGSETLSLNTDNHYSGALCLIRAQCDSVMLRRWAVVV